MERKDLALALEEASEMLALIGGATLASAPVSADR